MTRHAAAALCGLTAGVLLLHGWLLDALAGAAARREAPVGAAHAASRAVAVRVGAVAVTLAGAAALPLAATAEPAPPPTELFAQASPAPTPAAPPVQPPTAAPRAAAASAPKAATAARKPRAPASAPRKPAPPPPRTPAASAAVAPEPAASAAAGSVAAAESAGPVYRTRIPAAARLKYRLSRGAIVGSGEVDWRPEAGAYTLRLEGTLPLIGTLIEQTSRGSFDAAGLAPQRYTDRRLKRSELAANFQREAGRVGFSGGQPDQPLAPGMQDRLSVMLQLAAIAGAWAEPPAAGMRWSIPVVGARGDAKVWALRYEGRQSVDTPSGPVQALRFLREPDEPNDTRAEFWLDPARAFLPVKARMTDGRSDPFELVRE